MITTRDFFDLAWSHFTSRLGFKSTPMITGMITLNDRGSNDNERERGKKRKSKGEREIATKRKERVSKREIQRERV